MGKTQQSEMVKTDSELGVCSPEEEFGSETDFGSNQEQMSSIETPGSPNSEGNIREASKDLGSVSDLGSGFSSVAGGVLDALIPNQGDKGKATITINIPLDNSGSIKLQFRFITEAERDENGVKGRVQVGGGVEASRRDNFYFFTTDVFVRANVFGYAESYGDSSAEMFSLLSLGLQQRVAAVNTDIAAAVWDQATIDQTIAGMNPADASDPDDPNRDDYVETGAGIEVEAGASIGSSNARGSYEPEAGVRAGGGFQAGTRVSGDGSGGLQNEAVGKFEAFVAFDSSPFSGEAKFVRKSATGQLSEVEVEVSGLADMDAAELGSFLLQDKISSTIQAAASLIRGSSGMLQDENAAQKAGSIAGLVMNAPALGSMARAGTAEALAELERVGMKFGHKFTVKGVWNADKGLSGEVSLERVSTLEVGTDVRSPGINMALENLQRVFRIQLG